MWVLGGGLDPGRDYVFHYPNISNFSLQFGEAKSFWVPTQYLSLELIICFVKFRGILIRVIELGFSGRERGSYKQACCHSRGSLYPGPAGRLSLHTPLWSTPSWGAQRLGLCLWRSLQRNLSHSPHLQGHRAPLGSCPEPVPSPIWRRGVWGGREGRRSLPLRQRNSWRSRKCLSRGQKSRRSRFKWCWPKFFPIPESFSLRRTCLHSPNNLGRTLPTWNDRSPVICGYDCDSNHSSFQKSAGCKKSCLSPQMCADSAAISHTSLWSPHPPSLPVSWPALRKSQACCLLLHTSEGLFLLPPTKPGSHGNSAQKGWQSKVTAQCAPQGSRFCDLLVPRYFSNFCPTNHPVYPPPEEPLSSHHYYKQKWCSFRDH